MDARPTILPRVRRVAAPAGRQRSAGAGCRVRTGTLAVEIDVGGMTVRRSDPPGAESGADERLAAHTIIWAAGVRATPAADALASAAGTARDRIGRLLVEPDLSLPGYPEVLVVGDMVAVATCPASRRSPCRRAGTSRASSRLA